MSVDGGRLWYPTTEFAIRMDVETHGNTETTATTTTIPTLRAEGTPVQTPLLVAERTMDGKGTLGGFDSSRSDGLSNTTIRLGGYTNHVVIERR